MRKPQKVASYFFYKDRLHHILLGRKTDKMEMYFKGYENLKTFLVIKNIRISINSMRIIVIRELKKSISIC